MSYRVSWHYRNTDGPFHSHVLASKEEAAEYAEAMSGEFTREVWVEEAAWKRVEL